MTNSSFLKLFSPLSFGRHLQNFPPTSASPWSPCIPLPFYMLGVSLESTLISQSLYLLKSSLSDLIHSHGFSDNLLPMALQSVSLPRSHSLPHTPKCNCPLSCLVDYSTVLRASQTLTSKFFLIIFPFKPASPLYSVSEIRNLGVLREHSFFLSPCT